MRFSLRTLLIVMLLGGPMFVWVIVAATKRPILSLPVPFLFASAMVALGTLMATCLFWRMR